MMEDDLRREMDEIRRKKVAAEKKKAKEAQPEKVTADLDDEMEKIRQVRAAPAKAPQAEPKAEVKEVEGKEEKAEEPQIYVVQPGDSLSKIAKEVYGKAGRWKEIYEANKDQIKDPNLIRPGQELRIP
jgi:nucleoid-associated protein YgaU